MIESIGYTENMNIYLAEEISKEVVSVFNPSDRYKFRKEYILTELADPWSDFGKARKCIHEYRKMLSQQLSQTTSLSVDE